MYRIAGEEDALPSTYILMDTPIDYEAVITPVPTPTSTPTPTPAP